MKFKARVVILMLVLCFSWNLPLEYCYCRLKNSKLFPGIQISDTVDWRLVKFRQHTNIHGIMLKCMHNFTRNSHSTEVEYSKIIINSFKCSPPRKALLTKDLYVWRETRVSKLILAWAYYTPRSNETLARFRNESWTYNAIYRGKMY